MKTFQFILMALGIPWIHWTLAAIAAVLILSLCGCASSPLWPSTSPAPWIWYQRSVPPFPQSIAAEPCLWTEDGKTFLIDQNGVHEIK